MNPGPILVLCNRKSLPPQDRSLPSVDRHLLRPPVSQRLAARALNQASPGSLRSSHDKYGSERQIEYKYVDRGRLCGYTQWCSHLIQDAAFRAGMQAAFVLAALQHEKMNPGKMLGAGTPGGQQKLL
jgi:hypothetical protein